MPPVKVALLAGLAVIALAACGSTSAPLAGRGRIDDPRVAKSNRVQCLRNDHLQVREVGRTVLQVGALPAGPTIAFQPTPGDAQGKQIDGLVQSAEVIGSALLYPNQGSDRELKMIETCISKGVSG